MLHYGKIRPVYKNLCENDENYGLFAFSQTARGSLIATSDFESHLSSSQMPTR
jgi:hypothetical protein